ncbi:hypothetical protein AVEN_263531-1 [Araneus ventricosus]|uniref:Uncharacterized protein n=1 Tax=Araneus ventricosus TaxID=182803 RepID=A0A4Y2P1I5_ARAVE|nr:hypothetical protein AVEN_263531-1 [Araneus ventricosus]
MIKEDGKKTDVSVLGFEEEEDTPDSNFSLQQSLQACNNFDTARVKLEKFETSYCKRQSYHASNLQQTCCVKHIANYSRNRERRRQLDSNPRQPAS